MAGLFNFPDSMPVHNFLGFVDEQNTFPHTHRTFLYTYFTFIFYYNRESGEVCSFLLLPELRVTLIAALCTSFSRAFVIVCDKAAFFFFTFESGKVRD